MENELMLLMDTIKFDCNNKIEIPEYIKRVKVDVGLSINAPHSKLWLDHDEDLLVFGFEPNSNAIEQIKRHIPYEIIWPHCLDPKMIGDRIHLINCALGNENKENVKLYITEGDVGCSSLYQPMQIKVKHSVDVKQFTLETFFKLFPFDQIPYIEYLKIDAQGSDFNILKGCGDYIQNIIYVTIECDVDHYHNVSNDLQSIIVYMQNYGFKYIKHQNTIDPTFVNTKFSDIAETIYICQIG